MIRLVTMFRAAPLALALAALSSAALADDAKSPAPTADARPADKAKPRKHEQHFPMKAEQFKKVIDKRIAHARERLEKVLDDKKVPEATRAQIKKEFDAGAATVRAAADRAGSDGTVTKEEAKQIKVLAKDLKKKAHEKLGLGHKKGDKKTNRQS